MSKHQGFATMTPAQRKAIASLGGKAAHRQGRAHEWTPETATVAGRKGGETTKARKQAKEAREGDHD
jgi:general stress protein YciG